MKKKSLLGAIVASAIALFISSLVVPNMGIVGSGWELAKTLIFAGLVLGLINYFVKPIVKIITYPLKYLTFGLIGLIINILIIWGIDILFPELYIHGILALFLTSLIVWFCNLFVPKRKKAKSSKNPKMEPIDD